jgi:hypothetical protein
VVQRSLVLALAASLLATLVATATVACTSLKVAPEADGGAPGDDGGSPGDGAATDEAGDAGGPDAPGPYETYDGAQRFLSLMRQAGPVTAQGSAGRCTSKYFVWRDADGTMHSWEAKSGLRADHAFKSARPSFVPSDAFIAVDVTPSYASVAVYETGTTPNVLVDNIPYAFNFVAANDGIIRLDQSIDNVPLNGTKVRRWVASTKQTEDLSQVLPTQQPPVAFANGQVVVPGGVNVPFALHMVDVNAKTTSAVTFDDAVALRQVVPSPSGLLVSYARTGGAAGLRLYRNDKDDAASRVELGDAISALPALYADSPKDEHAFLSRFTTYGGNVVVFDSPYGVFAYDRVKARLAPLQLGKDKKVFFVDVLCVISDANLVAFREMGDLSGQIWTLSLPALLP